jgi:hypothetical protein
MAVGDHLRALLIISPQFLARPFALIFSFKYKSRKIYLLAIQKDSFEKESTVFLFIEW